MKAVIFNNESLIINTFDRKLQGNPMYGKILIIDLNDRHSLELLGTKISIVDIPVYGALEELKWDEIIDLNDLIVFELSSKPELVKLFEEVSQAWEEYCNAISSYISLYNRFPEVEVIDKTE